MRSPPRHTEWLGAASCRDADPDLFYPELHPATQVVNERRAKSVCFGCPVWRDCLGYALDNSTTHGVWGGLTASERTVSMFDVDVRFGPGRV